MFGYLLLISLFVERAIEVFLSAWRSGRADELDIEIANLNKQVAGSAKTTVEKLKLNLQSLEKD